MSPLTFADPTETGAAMDDAFNRGDVEALLGFYDPEAAVALEPGRAVSGRGALRSLFEKALQLAPQARSLRSEVLCAGDLALLLTHWELSSPGVDGGEVRRRGVATTVLRRSDAGWRAVIDAPWGPELLGLPPLEA